MLHSLTALQAADVQSTWDGTTNNWTSALNWNHSAPSLVGYPSNGVQTYDVRVDSGEITLTGTNTIDRLELNGGTLTVQKLITLSNSVWTGGTLSGEYAFGSEPGSGMQITGGNAKHALNLRTSGETLVENSAAIGSEGWFNTGNLEFRGPGSLIKGGPSSSQFVNFGNIHKRGSGEFLLDEMDFSCVGLLHIHEGTFRTRRSSNNNIFGPIVVEEGATLEINNPWVAQSNIVVSGGGLLRIASENSNDPGGSLRRYAYEVDSYILLSNAHVEMTGSSQLQNARVDSNSVVTLTGTNLSWFGFPIPLGISGFNSGKILAQVKEISLYLTNEGLFEIQTNCVFEGLMNNLGQVVKTGGDVTRFGSYVSVFNSGTFDTRVGTMEFEMRGGTNVGTFSAASGATNIIFGASGAGEYFTFDTDSRFLGEGQHRLQSVTVSGLVTNFSNVRMLGSFYGNGVFYNASNLVLESTFLNATIVNDGFALIENEALNAFDLPSISSLTNRSILEWKSGGFRGTIHNDSDIVKTSSSNFIVGAQTTLINRGRISIQEGSALFLNSFTNTASLSVSSNAELIVGGNFILGSGADLQGEGNVVVTNGGNLIITAPINVPFNLRISGGTLTLLADCTIGTQVTLNGGTVTGPADLIIASNANAFILNGTTAGAGKLLVRNGGGLEVSQEWLSVSSYSRRIENYGALRLSGYVWTAGEILNRGTAEGQGYLSGLVPVINEGIWNVHSNATWSLGQFYQDAPFFTNRGSLRVAGLLKSPYDGIYSEPRRIVQEAGETTLLGGFIDAVWAIRGGKLTGNGAVSGKLTSYGEISPGPTFGRLTVDRVSLTPGSSIAFDIGGTNTTAIDAVNTVQYWVSNNVTFVIRLVNGFMPKLGDEYPLMTGNPWETIYGPNYFPNFVGLTLTNGLRLVPIMYPEIKLRVVQQLQPGEKPVNVVRSANGHLRLTWPPSSIGSVLQTTTNLSTPWRSSRLADPSGVFDLDDYYKIAGKEEYFRFVDLEVQP